jgi:riboflavin kinase/FMN adenylyltransferase
MRIYRNLPEAREAQAAPGSRVVTVGFFDGVHRGHQKLLRDLGAWSAEASCEPAVVTFDEHPQKVLTGEGPLRLLSLEHRLLLLHRAGVAAALVLPFDLVMASWSAGEFIRRVAVDGLKARRLLMGFDSAFGHARKGTFDYVRQHQVELDIEVRQAGADFLGDERVSSTLVRWAVAAGDLVRLEKLLDRPFSLLGKVQSGDGRGRSLGFPTANLDVGGAALPPTGVYFGEATILGQKLEDAIGRAPGESPAGKNIGALVNVGKRPTFKDPTTARETVEAHLVDWSGDLYGQLLEVSFLSKHRDEKKFPSPDALRLQLQADLAEFRRLRAGAAAPAAPPATL